MIKKNIPEFLFATFVSFVGGQHVYSSIKNRRDSMIVTKKPNEICFIFLKLDTILLNWVTIGVLFNIFEIGNLLTNIYSGYLSKQKRMKSYAGVERQSAMAITDRGLCNENS